MTAEWAEKVKNDFISIYGVRGWEEVLKEVIRVRKQQRQLEEQKAREAGEVAAQQLSRAAWSTLAMLLLGAALSFFVGRMALTTRRVPLA